MKDSNPFGNLNAREVAKLSDLATRGMGHQMGRQVSVGSNSANAPDPLSPPLAGDNEMTDNMHRETLNRVGAMNPITPGALNEEEAPPPPEPADPDAIEIDMFARGNVDRVVDDLRAQKIEEQHRALAKSAGLPFVRLLGYPISPDVLALVPPEMARQSGIVAYLKAGNKLRIGVLDPSSESTTKALEILKEHLPYEFLMAVIGEDSYRYAMKLYEALPATRHEVSTVEIAKGAKRNIEDEISNLKDLAARIERVPTTKLIDLLLTGAVKVGASDIHIEPTETTIRIRYRLDGVLQTVVEVPTASMNALSNRLKFLAKLKLDVNHMPQDGRFTIDDKDGEGEHEIDIRVATIPVQYGEAVTMRLLDRSSLNLSIESLGLTGNALQKVLTALKRPQGLVLECGPTGSGKTTTLYALLSMLNDPGKKVITLEDPIEYRMDGVMQSQVEPEHGYDFGEGFRSVLRLDPDVVMVGEIRDALTAEMATQASLTGHVVLSTLHTNDAPTAIPRLIDLGVRPFLLSNAVNVIIAQRLVRLVCTHCSTETKPDAEALAEIKRRLAEVPESEKEQIPPENQWLFLKGAGCTACNDTGFSGRLGIFEVFTPTEELERMAIEHAPVTEVRRAAVKAGMMTMEQDGLIKALTGVTTIDEVWRVARDV